MIYNEQVSLTLADATDTVNEAIRLHGLSRPAAVVLGKTLAVMTFVSASLKEETGDVSVSVRGDGEGGNISVSGNYALRMRGCIDVPDIPLKDGETEEEMERRCFGDCGTLTIIRNDGYGRPFVGSCEFPKRSGVDEVFEEYYRISEQLPTYIASVTNIDEKGGCAYAGAVVLQPLPFAESGTLERLPSREKLKEIAESVPVLGLEKCAERYFSAKAANFTLREAAYKCNCSKEYLSGVLVSLGREQLKGILREEGEIKVHCHYCNKDYRFTQEDVDKLFP